MAEPSKSRMTEDTSANVDAENTSRAVLHGSDRSVLSHHLSGPYGTRSEAIPRNPGQWSSLRTASASMAIGWTPPRLGTRNQ